jgi:RhtB (resistance to homoserine/threonine) family protein
MTLYGLIMLHSQIFIFIGVATLLTITPGVDTMLVIRNVLARGRNAGFFTALGICSGLFFHATLSALGVSIILVRSATLFEFVKLLGACYLLFLGGRSLWQTWRGGSQSSEQDKPAPQENVVMQRVSPWRSFREGWFSNVLNPKVAVFYLAFLPQFINPGDPVLAKSLLLAAIHFMLGILWLGLVSLFLGRLRAWITRPAIKRAMETVTGVVLIAFGVRLVVEQR